MDFPVFNFGGGGEQEVINISDTLFARKFNETLAHQAMTVAMANARSGTRKQKTRAEVSHTRKKLFRQKGSGRARAGHRSTPLRRGGGRAFPASPNDNFHRRLSRRMFRAAMAVVLSQLVRENRFSVVRELNLESHKTRGMVKSLAGMNLPGNVLFVDTEFEENFVMAANNLPNIACLPFSNLLPTDLAAADVTVFSLRALQHCIKVWS